MTRPGWLVYSGATALVVVALGVITAQTLRLEAREARGRAEARQREAVRVALWRMDSALAPEIAREAASRYFHFRPFYPADRAYARMWDELRDGEVLVPSPLLRDPGPRVRLHFQVDPDGTVSSPQVPVGPLRDTAEATVVDHELVLRCEARLAEVALLVGGGRTASSVAAELGEQIQRQQSLYAPTLQPDAHDAAVTPPDVELMNDMAARRVTAELALQANQHPQTAAAGAPTPTVGFVAPPGDRAAEDPARELSKSIEQAAAPADAGLDDARLSTMTESFTGSDKSGAADALLGARLLDPDRWDALRSPGGFSLRFDNAAPDLFEGPLAPVWRTGSPGSGPELFLVRTVRVRDRELIQGVWMDWDSLRRWLLSRAADVVPGATLRPVYPESAAGSVAAANLLATVPAELVVGAMPAAASPALTPARIALGLTWAAVLAAVAAIGAALRRSMELADRRGRFVSAVTHELRTPLTTFCLYTQMLADGVIRDEPARTEYLGTLRREAHRLAGIVENVLAYARLGRPGRRGPRPVAPVTDLIDRATPSLAARAAQAGMTLDFDHPGRPTDSDLARPDSTPHEAGLPGPILPETVLSEADPATVERILMNLVDNACKYAASADDRRIHLSATADHDSVRVRVTDHGPGVPAADRDRIFEPFHRARRDADSAAPGIGLGLALARGLARELGGDLRLAPGPPGGGASFLLILRRTGPADRPTASRES